MEEQVGAFTKKKNNDSIQLFDAGRFSFFLVFFFFFFFEHVVLTIRCQQNDSANSSSSCFRSSSPSFSWPRPSHSEIARRKRKGLEEEEEEEEEAEEEEEEEEKRKLVFIFQETQNDKKRTEIVEGKKIKQLLTAQVGGRETNQLLFRNPFKPHISQSNLIISSSPKRKKGKTKNYPVLLVWTVI